MRLAMPTKARPPKAGRPAGGRQTKPKFKLWVLWEPPSQLLMVLIVAALFAGAGIIAIRYSSAQSIDDGSDSGTSPLLWQDVPDSEVGSLLSASSNKQKPLQNWRDSSQYIYGGTSVRVVPDSTKGKALEFFAVANRGHSDSYGSSNQRAEQVADVGLKKDSTYWFGFDLFVAPGSGIATGRQSVWQLLPQPNKSPAKLWLALNSNQEGLAIETDKASMRIGAVPDTQWTRIVIGVHVQSDNTAWIEAWRDGQLALSRQSVEGGVLSGSASSAIASMGLYRSTQPWDLSVRMANLKIGATRDVVL
jgi:hypothetical protein